MSDADFNPFLQRAAGAPNLSPDAGGAKELEILQQTLRQKPAEEAGAFRAVGYSPLPYSHETPVGVRTSRWFWSFISATFVVSLLLVVTLRLLVAPQADFGNLVLISTVLGAAYAAFHATRRGAKYCRAFEVDHDAIRLTYGKNQIVIDPREVDAVMSLSGISLAGDDRGFSSMRNVAILTGAKVERLGFETVINRLLFEALREVCVHAWAIHEEGGLLPPREIAEHHADRAGIDSLRRLRKFYGNFVMRLAFSSLAILGLMAAGVALFIASLGPQRFVRLRAGGVKLLIVAGGLVLSSLSGLRRIPREWGVLRKIKEAEKSLAVTLGLDFAQ